MLKLSNSFKKYGECSFTHTVNLSRSPEICKRILLAENIFKLEVHASTVYAYKLLVTDGSSVAKPLAWMSRLHIPFTHRVPRQSKLLFARKVYTAFGFAPILQSAFK